MKNWYDIYVEQIEKNGGYLKYINLKVFQKRKLLKLLRSNSGSGKIIEAGCGTGIICSKLGHEGYNVTGIDIDESILGLAAKLEKNYFGSNIVNFEKKSIFELDYPDKSFDLCYSVGVLEHFSDNQIVNSLKQQLRIAKKVIVVIPTKWFGDNESLKGDDRFLPLSYWRNIIKVCGGKILKEYSYAFKRNKIDIMLYLKKFFKPKAYRIFLIGE